MSQLHRFTGPARLIAILTLLSRVLGMIREMAFSHYFGTSPLLSAFRVAFQVPNLGRRLFGEGALTSSFIPVFTRCREAGGDEPARRLAGGVLTLISAILLGLLLITEIALAITHLFTWNATLALSAILMPFMVLICVTAFFAGILNALSRFAAPALAPSILNAVMIAAVWAGQSRLGLSDEALMHFISGSVLVAGVLQLASQVAWLRTTGFRLRINFHWSDPNIRRVITMMLPMVLGLSAVSINTLVDSLIALVLVKDGRGPAVLGYAQYLYQLPLGIFGIALATAIFPLLAKHAARHDLAGFAQAVGDGIRTTLFISIPAGLGLILVGRPLVRVMFEHGEFNPADTPRVVASLICYNLGTWAYALHHMLVRAFYALEDSRTPMVVSVLSVVANFVLNIVLVLAMQEAGVALATAICASAQVIALAVLLGRRVPHLPWRGVLPSVGRSALAAAVMTVAVLATHHLLPANRVGGMIDLALSLSVGAGGYFACAWLLGMDELATVLRPRRRPADTPAAPP